MEEILHEPMNRIVFGGAKKSLTSTVLHVLGDGFKDLLVFYHVFTL